MSNKKEDIKAIKELKEHGFTQRGAEEALRRIRRGLKEGKVIPLKDLNGEVIKS